MEGLSGEQYALEDALEDLAAAPRRGTPHALVAVGDPANVWGRIFTLTAADGTKVTPPRAAGWVVLRDGAPVVLAEDHGREIRTLAAWQPTDLSGVIDALAGVLERPAACRPVRRIEVAAWNGQPVASTDAFTALRRAGLVSS